MGVKKATAIFTCSSRIDVGSMGMPLAGVTIFDLGSRGKNNFRTTRSTKDPDQLEKPTGASFILEFTFEVASEGVAG